MRRIWNRAPKINTRKQVLLEQLDGLLPETTPSPTQENSKAHERLSGEVRGRRRKAMIAIGSLVAGAVVVAGAFWPSDKSVEHSAPAYPMKEAVSPHGSDSVVPESSEAVVTIEENESPEVNGSEVLNSIITQRAREISEIEGATSWDRAYELYGDHAAPKLTEAVANLQSQGVNAQWHGNPMTSTNAYISVGGLSDTNHVWDEVSQALAEQQARDFLDAAGQAA